MPTEAQELRQTQARIEARSRAASRDVLAILRRQAALIERRALAAAKRKRRLPTPREKLAKADTRSALEKELARILERYMGQQSRDAARRVGAPDVAPEYVAQLAERAIFTAKRLLARSDREMTASVNRVIVDSIREGATVADTAKRIREQFHGTGGGRVVDVRETDTTVTTGQTRRLSVNRGVTYWISSERAAAIARTEIGEAEESGKIAGFEALGVKEIEWISRQWAQGRHQSMNGVRVKLGEKFTYPDGSRGSYPRSPDSPVRHRVNCRCTTKPVIKRGKK